MKKYPYKIISVLISAILIISIMPFYFVHADSNTYIVMSDCNVEPEGNNFRKVSLSGSSEIRLTVIKRGIDYHNMFISESSFKYKAQTSSSQACPTADTYAGQYSYNGSIYYYYDLNSSVAWFGAPVSATVSSDSQVKSNAVNYTFGNGAVGPEPPITAGDLTFNYYTDFASTQQNNVNALKSNRDTIIWDYDTTGSNIQGVDLKVDIRAVPTKYYSSTETGLNSLSWGDLSIESSYAADLGSYQMNWNNRKVSFTWEEVVNNIKYNSNLPDYYDQMVNFWNFKKRFTGNYWYYTGWIYQIRLNTYSGDYTGEWQTIYQISSAPPEESTQVINYYVTGTGLPQDVYQTIQNVNNQNNITNNTWYINGSPFDVNDETGQNWWETLLQFIRDLVSEILSFLGSIFDSLINAIFGLIEDLGIDFLGLFQTLLNGIVDFFHNLDLTSINFQLPQSFNNFIQGFSGSVNGILGIWINNGLAVFIFVPLIIWLIGVIL